MQGRGKCRDGLSGMSSEGQRIWSIKIGCVTSLIITSSFTLLMILQTFLTSLNLIWQLSHYDSHSLEAVSHSLSQVIRSSHFSIYILFFYMMSHSFIFSKMEFSGIFLRLIDEEFLTDPRNVA